MNDSDNPKALADLLKPVRLWNFAPEAYFDSGRVPPGIAVLRLQAHQGAYWTSPSGRVGSLIGMIEAKLGNAQDSGEHGAITLGQE